jgi:hypothetical protein
MNPVLVRMAGMGSDFIAQPQSWARIQNGKIMQPGISDAQPEMLIISPPGLGIVPAGGDQLGNDAPPAQGSDASQVVSPMGPGPGRICPAWGCAGETDTNQHIFYPGGPITITVMPGGNPPAPTPAPSPVTPAQPVTPIILNPAAAAPPTTSTLVTGGATNTSAAAAASMASASGTLTPLQQSAGAVALNTSGQPVDASGNVVSTFDEFTTWMSESSLISSVPNWVLALGAAGGLLLLYGKGRR